MHVAVTREGWGCYRARNENKRAAPAGMQRELADIPAELINFASLTISKNEA